MKHRKISVLTLNCQRAHMKDALEEYLRRIVRERAHNFILLQEVDKKVLAILGRSALAKHGYARTEPANSQVCIVYKKRYALESVRSIRFVSVLKPKNWTVGAVLGSFDGGQGSLLVCSAHLHAGQHLMARRKAIRELREALLASDARIKIVGGDFNLIFPGELRHMVRKMRPFVHATTYDTHSHEMALVERNRPSNKFVSVFAEKVANIKTKIDHIYVDSEQPLAFRSRVHRVTVSDHRPVEMTMSMAHPTIKE